MTRISVVTKLTVARKIAREGVSCVTPRRLASSLWLLRLGVAPDDRGRIELALARRDQETKQRQSLRCHRHGKKPVARGRLQHLQGCYHLARAPAQSTGGC